MKETTTSLDVVVIRVELFTRHNMANVHLCTHSKTRSTIEVALFCCKYLWKTALINKKSPVFDSCVGTFFIFHEGVHRVTLLLASKISYGRRI